LAGVAIFAAVGIVMAVEPADKLEVVGAGVETEVDELRAAEVFEVKPADPVLNEAAIEVEATVEEAGVAVGTGVESAVGVRTGVIVLREAVELRAAVVLKGASADPGLTDVEGARVLEVIEDAGAVVLGGDVESTLVVMAAFQTPQSEFLGSFRLVMVAEN